MSKNIIKLVLTITLCTFTYGVVSASPLRVVAPTTLVESGIISALVDDFKQLHPELKITISSVGALKVIEMASRGEADLIFSHYPEGENIFLNQGFGIYSAEIMYNFFAFIGPIDHGLDLHNVHTAKELLQLLAEQAVDFIAPHPRSGTTHQLKKLMSYSGINSGWEGYYSSGTTAIKTLLLADENEQFTFADMGTYLTSQNKMAGSIIPLFRDDVALQNRISAIVVNAEQFPEVDNLNAELFWNYLIENRAQLLIQSFTGKNSNTKIFTPIAHLDPNVIALQLAKENKQRYVKLLLLSSILILLALLTISILIINWRSKKAEKVRLQIEKRFSVAMDSSHEGIWDWNLLSGECYISHQCQTILGSPKIHSEQITDPKQWLFDHIEAGYHKSIYRDIQHHIKQSDTSPFSYEILQEIRGKETHLSIHGRVMLNEHNKAVNIIGSVTDITQSHLQGEQLKHFTHIALHDALTGLPNRLMLTQRLDHEIAIGEREKKPVTLLLLDLDGFKAINDNLGHHVGDEILIKVAKQLQQAINRKTDLVSRLGGDEFVIIITDSDANHTIKMMEEITAAIREIAIEGQKNLVGISIGIAEFPIEANTAEELMKAADSAMYRAKRKKY